MPAQLYLSCCPELPSGELPEKIQLIPAGKMVGNDGRGFNNSKPQAILDFFAAKQRDIPLDIEHATEIKGTKGNPAPAQGWLVIIKKSKVDFIRELYFRVNVLTQNGADLS